MNNQINSRRVLSLNHLEVSSGLLFIVAFTFTVLPSGLTWETTLATEMLEGSWIVRLQWISLFICSWIMMRNISFLTLISHVKGNWGVFIVVAYCSFSIFWSDFPEVVLKRFVQFLGVMSILLVVAHYHERRFDRLLALTLWVGLVFGILSIVFALFVPEIGVEKAWGIEGSWRGILVQKNQLGLFSALIIYFTVFCFFRRVASPMFSMLVVSVSLCCLVMSRSSSSLTLVFLSISVFLLLRVEFIRAHALIIRAFLILAFFLCVLYLGFYFFQSRFPAVDELLAPFAALFGKSTDLTGRSDIWEIMWRTIDRHPYFGVGFSSFWLGPGGPSQFIVDELMWPVPSAHNGYLEIINELGWIGLALFVVMMIYHGLCLIKLFKYERELCAFHMGLVFIYLLSNFSESTALRVLFIFQFIQFFSMVMVVATLQRLKNQMEVRL